MQKLFPLQDASFYRKDLTCFFIDTLLNNTMSSLSSFIPKTIFLVKKGWTCIFLVRLNIIEINCHKITVLHTIFAEVLLNLFLKFDACSLNGRVSLETHSDISKSLLSAIFLFHIFLSKIILKLLNMQN